MRRLLWFTIGFGMASVLSVFYLWDTLLLPYMLSFILAGILCCLFAVRIRKLRIFAAIFIGFGAGMGWFMLFQHFYITPVADLDGATIRLSVHAAGYCEESRYSMETEGFAYLNGIPYKIQLYLDDDLDIQPGDILEGDFRLRLKTPEGERSSDYSQGVGCYLTATQKSEIQITRPEELPLWALPARTAHHAKDILTSCFPEDTRAFAKALLLGDTSDLSYTEDTALKISGIRHIVAVSGLHVSMVFGLVAFLLRFNRGLATLISLPLLAFFAAVTGFTPSVTRACLMMAVMQIGFLIREEYDPLTGLSFAALFMMVLNPYVVKSVSFQLSVSSVAGILLFGSPIYTKIWTLFSKVKAKSPTGRLLSWFSAAVSVSVSALIFTTPLSAFYFGTVSLVGVLTNLLVLWAVSIVFCSTVIVCLLGSWLPMLCTAGAWLISWLIRYVQLAARTISAFPYAAVYTQSTYIVIWLILCYCLIAVYFLLGRKKLRIYLLVGAGTLCGAILLSVNLPKLDAVRLNVLDVGEGQCILLQSCGQNFMIDCGGDSDTEAANMMAQTLLSQGITHLDGAAFTHYDRDHTGGLEHLVTRIAIDALYFPDMEDDGFLDNINDQLVGQINLVSENTLLSFGVGQLLLTAPGNMKTSNENCMCVLFASDNCDILITGDRGRSGEKRLLKENTLPDVDVLIGGHHGSKYATSNELLDAVTPEIVIFSVGENNIYGHPAQEVLERLENHSCTVYRTDQQGTVLIRRQPWQKNRLWTAGFRN